MAQTEMESRFEVLATTVRSGFPVGFVGVQPAFEKAMTVCTDPGKIVAWADGLLQGWGADERLELSQPVFLKGNARTAVVSVKRDGQTLYAFPITWIESP